MADSSGPAFPRPKSFNPSGHFESFAQDGMSLRDWFAGQALIGFIMRASPPERYSIVDSELAERAYEFAAAMLEARQKPA